MRNMDREFIEALRNTTEDPTVNELCRRFVESGEIPKAKGSEKRYLRGEVDFCIMHERGKRDTEGGKRYPIVVEYDRTLNLLSFTTLGEDWKYASEQVAHDGDDDINIKVLNIQESKTTIFYKEWE